MKKKVNDELPIDFSEKGRQLLKSKSYRHSTNFKFFITSLFAITPTTIAIAAINGMGYRGALVPIVSFVIFYSLINSINYKYCNFSKRKLVLVALSSIIVPYIIIFLILFFVIEFL
ncbi:hypothetical protein HOL46_02055 [Candidatus Falkowbacteria bacterium]|jgi:hypothetical protein|nr:hypothetical protein [Candidatus Falkowbacteria bacterium]